MVTLVKAWEQRETETGRAYKAFIVYLEQGPGRSFNETTRRFYNNDKSDSSKRIREWAAANDWVSRARELRTAYPHEDADTDARFV